MNCYVKYKTIIVKFAGSEAKVVLFSISNCDLCFDLYIVFSGNHISSQSFYITYKVFYTELQSVSRV